MKPKRLILSSVAFFLSMLLALAALGQSFPTNSTLLDDFSGSLANWTDGVTGTGTCAINSGVLNGNSGTDDCYYSASSFGEDQEMFVSFPNATSHQLDTNLRVCMCLQDNIGTSTVDGYCFRYRPVTGANNDIIEIERMNNAGFTGLGTAYQSVDFTDGDQVGLSRTSADVLTLWYRAGGTGSWTQIDQTTDGSPLSSCTSTFFGVILPNATQDVDDFSGGDTLNTNNLLGIPPIFFN